MTINFDALRPLARIGVLGVIEQELKDALIAAGLGAS